jgi:multiple sugar transport system permease protein
MTRGERRKLGNGLMFASPFILGFLVFYLYPFAASIYYSFCQFNVLFPPVWTGMENFRMLFAEDDRFWKSLYNTLYYTALSVPLGIATALVLAVLLNMKVKGQSLFRTFFFLPTIVPAVASAVLWIWVFTPEGGLFNGVLLQFTGLQGPGWLADKVWSKPAFVLMSAWTVGGAMVIFLAGLTNVPKVLYEAAEIDGAGRWAKFRNVTLPMLTPTILFNLVMGLIGAFQFFTQAYVMTGGRGGPVDSTLFYAIYLYRNAFYYLRMGYASAMAWMLFVVILAATLAVLASSKRWVHYEGKR